MRIDRESLAPVTPEQKKLQKATREMEGYFVGMLLKKMHEASARSKLFPQDSAGETYREMFDEAVGAAIGRQGAFGIADTLYRELAPRYAEKSQEPAGERPPQMSTNHESPKP